MSDDERPMITRAERARLAAIKAKAQADLNAATALLEETRSDAVEDNAGGARDQDDDAVPQLEDDNLHSDEESEGSSIFLSPARPQRSAATSPMKKVAGLFMAETTKESNGFRGGTYALIQDQLRDIKPFDGDTKKQSFDVFEYKFNMAMDLATEIPDKMKLAMLRQKLTGPPAEFLRLDPKLQEYDFQRLMGWLRTQYGDLFHPTKEDRTWQADDTPDSYYLRIQRGLEADLTPIPPKMLGKRDAANPDTFEKDTEGRVVLEKNPAYEAAMAKRAAYLEESNRRLIRDYLDGLKPQYLAKITKKPAKFDELHQLVRDMWDMDQRHPVKGPKEAVNPPAGLPVFTTANTGNSNSKKGGKKGGKGQNMVGLELAYHEMAGVTKGLIEAVSQMTSPKAVKPTARAGTAKDPADPTPPKTGTRLCYNCDQPDHFARECPLPDRRKEKGGANSGKGSKGKGDKKQKDQAQRGANGRFQKKGGKGKKKEDDNKEAKKANPEQLINNLVFALDKFTEGFGGQDSSAQLKD